MTYPSPSDPTTAFSRVDGTTEGHDIDHGRVIGIWENVKHHGAYGDDSHDDTAALQAAHDAAVDAGYTSVYVPAGVYRHTGLTWDARIALIGAGVALDDTPTYGTILKYTPSTGTALSVTGTPSVTIGGPRIESIGFVGPSSGGSTVGIYLDGTLTAIGHGTLYHVGISGFGTGCKTYETYEVNFLGCYMAGNGTNLELTQNSNGNLIIGGAYRVAAGVGIHILDSSSIFIAPATVIESNGGTGLHVESAGGNVIALTIGGHYENNGNGGILFEGNATYGVYDSLLSGVTFNTNTGNDLEGIWARNIFASGVYFSSSNEVVLDSHCHGWHFQGMRQPVTLTDNGYGNLWEYEDGANDSYHVMLPSTGYGLHLKDAPLELDEISDPAAPAANQSRVYTRDNGAGKTQLVVRFPTGAVQVIATEP